uniref:Deoxyuridine 5'-triphosphate nucleotidohydrolase n=1 Tax=Magallana gigas TaxID=29159 RepID=K1QHS7_MAGGI
MITLKYCAMYSECIPNGEKIAGDYTIPARGKHVVDTDIQIAVPSGCYERIAGVIDPDYRGNVGVVMFNFGADDFKVKKGDRIAQLICEKIHFPKLQEVEVRYKRY